MTFKNTPYRTLIHISKTMSEVGVVYNGLYERTTWWILLCVLNTKSSKVFWLIWFLFVLVLHSFLPGTNEQLGILSDLEKCTFDLQLTALRSMAIRSQRWTTACVLQTHKLTCTRSGRTVAFTHSLCCQLQSTSVKHRISRTQSGKTWKCASRQLVGGVKYTSWTKGNMAIFNSGLRVLEK